MHYLLYLFLIAFSYLHSIKLVVLAGDVGCAWFIPDFLSFFACGVLARIFLASLARLLVFVYSFFSLDCRDPIVKMVSLGEKLKIPKTCETAFYKKNVRVVLCKTPLEKTPNIREMRQFRNRPSCKGNSPCMQRLYIAFAKWSVWIKN